MSLKHRPLYIGIALLFAAPAASAVNASVELETPTITVIGTTPLPGIGVAIEKVPANVQSRSGNQVKQQQTLDISEHLTQNIPGVVSSPSQENPWQSDISFRGFVASPLQGAPQGLSVFLDGVRINEAFGDTVNWDLLPPNALAAANLMPGSNPVFGLNTLGGALSLVTKSGFRNPGGNVEITGGSWGRASTQFEHGGHDDDNDYFVAGNVSREDGWREHSPSNVNQFFAKVGHETESMDLDVSLLLADNRLYGTQALPLSMLDNPRQGYTWPDRTDNRLSMLSGHGSRFLDDKRLVSWGAYLRRLESTNVSSNSNENFDPLLPATIANAQGSMDRSLTESSTWGLSLQYTDTRPWAGMDNQWSLGATLDAGRTEFRQWSAPGNFTADRTVTVIGPEAMDTFARTHNRYAGVYFTDTLSLNPHWHTTLSGRWNNAQVNIADASGSNPALNGDHHFTRFNPAVGVNFTPVASFTAYGSYNEGMRVATPMELSCADPAVPCKLPNNFLADPSLKPVISRTLETGMRGHLSEDLSYSAAIFRTTLDDDIQFISSGGNVNAGYFQNVGQTRRQGLELGVEQRVGKLNLSAGYSYLQSTYESSLTLHSPSNSSADGGGDIQVQPGNKMPGIPMHNLRLRADYSFERGRIGASLVAVGSQYARGDENNQDSHGKLPGYSVVNLDGEYHLGRDWDLLGRVSNLFDRRSEGVAVLGDNLFTGPGRSFNPTGAIAEQFRSPASPRGLWIGLRYAWSGK